eukprot:UN08068
MRCNIPYYFNTYLYMKYCYISLLIIIYQLNLFGYIYVSFVRQLYGINRFLISIYLI